MKRLLEMTLETKNQIKADAISKSRNRCKSLSAPGEEPATQSQPALCPGRPGKIPDPTQSLDPHL